MSKRVVLDASAAIRLVQNDPEAEGFIIRLAEAPLVLVPDLYVGEVANALWKYVRHDSLDRDLALQMLSEARSLIDIRVANDELAEEAFVAAVTYGHPVYDMLYAVLARRHGACVLTADRRLLSALEAMSIDAFRG